MNILEIAKECGILDQVECKGGVYYDFDIEELQAFANAVIEKYKESLVPVGNHYLGQPPIEIDVQLYALKEAK